MDNDNEHVAFSVVEEPVFASNGGILFPNAHHFTVAGGSFVNTMNNHITVPALPPDFRMIPLGDIDLQQELLVTVGLGVVGHRRGPRRVYAAKVHDRTSDVTVALYEGYGAEEEWRRDVASYIATRHPNIIQIFGGASYGSMHATIFHGDLIPLKRFVAGYSPITTVYLYACYWNEWNSARKYLISTFQRLTWINPSECTMWIRGSTGRLSADLVPPDSGDEISFELDWAPHLPSTTTLGTLSKGQRAASSLPLEQYHYICTWCLSQSRVDFISSSAVVTLGVVVLCPAQNHYEDRVEVASLPNIAVRISGWRLVEGTLGDLMGNGWKRYRAEDAFNTEVKLELYSLFLSHFWLSQANHIFRRRGIVDNLEDYTLTSNINFTILTSNAEENTPPGFLFLCPKEEFQIAPGLFKWPDCPAYWSLDPLGVIHLSDEQATELGFPSMKLQTNIAGRCWDSSVYAGLRDFHRAEGFDPDSQAVGIHLGYPPFRLCREVNSHFRRERSWYRENINIDIDATLVGDGDEINTDNQREDNKEEGDTRDWSGESEALVQEEHWNESPEEDNDHNNVDELRISFRESAAGVYSLEPEVEAIVPDLELHSTEQDIPAILGLLINIQLALIIFLAICWMYGNMQ